MMLHTKYQGYIVVSDFSGFPYIPIWKNVTPEAPPFMAPWASFEQTFVEVLTLDNAACRISRLYALWF